MFTLVQGVLLRPLPVREQHRLVVAWKTLPSSGFAHHPFGDVAIERVAQASRLFDRVAGVDANDVGRDLVIEDGQASDVNVALVTGGFFDVLGVEPVLGRGLARADDVEGTEHVAVISHGLWRRRYGAARDVIGRRVTIDGQRFAIVGVMPPDVDYPAGVELWRTTRSVPTDGPFRDAARREIDLVGRLRSGVRVEQAAAELTSLTRRFEAEQAADATRGLVPVVRSFEDVVVGDVRAAIVALMAAVALVLLIASANVANLLLMRGESRRAELAIHEALGAGRAVIVRRLLAESAVLTLAGAAAGLVAAWWSLHGVLALLPEGLPRTESIRIDAVVFVFAALLGLVTSALAGLAPAWSLGRADLLTPLRSGGRGSSGRSSRRVRRALVVAQVALAVSVVAAAGLLTRSMLRLQSVDTGLAADRLVFVELSMPPAGYVDRTRHRQFLDQVVTRLESLPAIAGATPVNAPPFSGEGGWDVPLFTAEDQSAARAAVNPSLNLESIHPNYFRTLNVAIVRGRPFTAADRHGMRDVAIVSEDVAARTWPGEDPIGKRLKFGPPASSDPWRTVVGVAALTRYRTLATPRATIYLPAAQFLETAQRLAVRSSASLDLVTALVREHVRAVDPDVRVTRVAPFSRMRDRPLARPMFNAFLSNLFAAAALLLATVGLYAVMAASVRQRDREIAVRIALGATPARVGAFVAGEALWLAGLGAAVGFAAAAAAMRAIRGLLFEVHPLDPATIAGAALLLTLASVAASFWPIRRATRIDAVATLRN